MRYGCCTLSYNAGMLVDAPAAVNASEMGFPPNAFDE
jgi:hypothetical protein